MVSSNRKISQVVVFVISAMVMVSFQNCEAPKKPEVEKNDFSSSVGENLTQINDGNQDEYQAVQENASTNNLMLMDRVLLFNLFSDIFGPQFTNLAVAEYKLKNRLSYLGGPCSLYDRESYIKEDANISGKNIVEIATTVDFWYENRLNVCDMTASPNSQGAMAIARDNVLRQALVVEVCKASLENTDIMNYVLPQIQVGSSVDALPANNRSNALNLFRLFYRGKSDPEVGLLDSLNFIVGPYGQTPSIEGWQAAIYTVCTSGHWQTL